MILNSSLHKTVTFLLCILYPISSQTCLLYNRISSNLDSAPFMHYARYYPIAVQLQDIAQLLE